MRLSREFAELDPIVATINALRKATRERDDLQQLIDDPASDKEMVALAEEELRRSRPKTRGVGASAESALLPKDAADEKSAILEVRAGTGGDEAALFAGDLFRMYQRYAEQQGWKVNILSASESATGGYKEIIANITGKGVFARLKFEVRRASRAAGAGDRGARPHPHFRGDGRRAARGRGGRRQDRGQGPAHRRVPRERPGRPVGQHHRQRGQDHTSADRHRGQPAGREVAAQEQGQRR